MLYQIWLLIVIFQQSHVKGSRHKAAASKLKERELAREFEVNKRIALEDFTGASSTICERRFGSANKPLIGRAQKAASEILNGQSLQCSPAHNGQDVRPDICYYKENPSTETRISTETVTASVEAVQQQLHHRDRHERELKFTAAGWKRDGHGRWFKDENVSFCAIDHNIKHIYCNCFRFRLR